MVGLCIIGVKIAWWSGVANWPGPVIWNCVKGIRFAWEKVQEKFTKEGAKFARREPEFAKELKQIAKPKGRIAKELV